ncbi:lysine-specific histone demethylase 1 [Musa troglodytarum]|uniref:Lysine-specific histone demethylase 1 n=1 Tax=Musa troglodytarum TaxID=320322 RepID=A0A9E7FK24_9LILI|nr:lysine-specific histone demethylase 1 [Musa troglodytarum]
MERERADKAKGLFDQCQDRALFQWRSGTKPNTFRFPRVVLASVIFDLRSPSPDASGSLMALAPWPSSLSLLADDRRFFPSFRRSQELRLLWSSNPYLVRRSPAPCCSGEEFRRGRALKRNEELCHELREFISAMGLAENHVPSMKELCENGRKDLANIVRRRGYKVVTELLLNSNGENRSDKISEGRQRFIDAELYKAADNQNEINRLKILLLALSNLHARATIELGDIKRIIAEKDAELHAAEGNLTGLKEVRIDYWANGQIIEVAGSFNGWQHRVRMDHHPSSKHVNPPGYRKPMLWSTVLWLYPGVYEIKFIVDGEWRIDSQWEITTSGGITNNILRAKSSKEADLGKNPETQSIVEEMSDQNPLPPPPPPFAIGPPFSAPLVPQNPNPNLHPNFYLNPNPNFYLQVPFQTKRKRTGVRRRAAAPPSSVALPPPLPSLAAPPPAPSNPLPDPAPQNPDPDISEEIIVINKEATTEALTALTAGFPADSLTEEEIEAGVVSSIGGIEQVNYILIRNHILSRWRENVSNWLTKETFVSVIPPHYEPLLNSAYNFLVSHGYVNFGVAPAIKERIPTEPTKTNVVIVGAGLAGLAAARQLMSFGFKVVVLEGRKRCGGRVYTKRMEGANKFAAADLGGSVLTGTLGNPLGIIAKQLGSTLHKVRDKCPLYRPDGKPVDPDLDTKVENAFNKLLDKASRLRQCMGEVAMDVSLGAALETFRQVYGDAVTEEEMNLFNWHLANLEYANAGLLSKLSLAFWDQDDPYDMGGDHCFLPGGNGRLVQALSENVPIIYEKTVHAIRYGGDGVQVISGSQVYEGDMALCTVPLGVLKNGSIKFVPELPQRKLDGIKRGSST